MTQAHSRAAVAIIDELIQYSDDLADRIILMEIQNEEIEESFKILEAKLVAIKSLLNGRGEQT